MSRNALEFGEQAALFVSIGAMDVILQLLGYLWHFALANPEISTFITGGGIAFLGWLMPKVWRSLRRVWRSLRRARQQPLLMDNFPFKCVSPGSDDIMQQVLDSAQDKADPLADFNIPYQSRQTDRDVQRELEHQLKRKRWLLILGREGLGKTREAAELAKIYSQGGWVVLRLKNNESGLLAEPARFPVEQIGMSQPKLLFVLDNLNQAMFLGRRRSTPANTASEQDGQRLAQALDRPFHDRLLKTLQFYEDACGNGRIRVIATAHNEPGELEKLELDEHPDFWNRFEQHELLPPSEQAIVNLLTDRTAEAQIDTDPAEFTSIARSNDGTFRNVVENLIRVKKQKLKLTSQTFVHSLDGTWEDRYQTAIETYPIAVLIYDAIDLLRQMRIALHDFTVLPTAQLLMTGNSWQRLRRKRKLKQALDYLRSKDAQILQPRDGQIEAKGTQVEADSYLPALLNLLLHWVDRRPQVMLESLFGFGVEANNRQRYCEAIASFDRLLTLTPDETVWFQRGYSLAMLERYPEALESFDRAVALKPDSHEAWSSQGAALFVLGRKEEAIDSYNKALKFKPDYHKAWYNLGIALSDSGQHQAAIDSYDKAIEFKLDDHEAWNNRGNALSDLGQHQAAIDSFDKAIEFKRDYHKAWYNRGIALSDSGQHQAAIDSYDKAIEFKRDDHEAWNNRGNALSDLGQHQAAIDSFDKAIEFKRDYHEAWYNRGIALSASGQHQAAIDSFDKAIEFKLDLHEAWYNKACCYGLQGNVEKALEHLRRAIELDSEYRKTAKTDTDFDAIRSDDRFQSLIGGGEQENDRPN